MRMLCSVAFPPVCCALGCVASIISGAMSARARAAPNAPGVFMKM